MKKDSGRIGRCLKNASKMTNKHCDTFDEIFLETSVKKLNSILNDPTHPLYPLISRSPRSGRILHVSAKTSRYFNSFLPLSIRNNCDNARFL